MSIDLFLYTLGQSVKLLVVSSSKERETTVRYQKSLFVTDSRCRWTGYLLRLRCASLSKLSKSMESYLLFVEAGSKSSEWESERGKVDCGQCWAEQDFFEYAHKTRGWPLCFQKNIMVGAHRIFCIYTFDARSCVAQY